MNQVDTKVGNYGDVVEFVSMNPTCPLGSMNWGSHNWLGAESGRARNPFSKQSKATAYGGLDIWCGDSAEEKYYGSPDYFGGKNVNQDYFAPYEYGQGPYTKDFYNTSSSYHAQTIQIVNHNGGEGVTPLPIIGFTATLFNPGSDSNFAPDARWNFVWGHFTSATKKYTYFFPMSSPQYTLRNSWERTNLSELDYYGSSDPLAIPENSFKNVKFTVDSQNKYKIFSEDLYMTGLTISFWQGRWAGKAKYTGHSMFNLMPVIHPDFFKINMSIAGGGFGSAGLQQSGTTMLMPALKPLYEVAQNQWWKNNNITEFARGSGKHLQNESLNQNSTGKYFQASECY